VINIFDVYRSESDLEKGGVWVELSGMRFKLARIGGANEGFLKLVRKRLSPYRRALDSGALDETFARGIMAGVIAESVLLDWEGVSGPDGPIAYSKEAATDLLTKLPNLMFDLREQAEKFETFRADSLEQDAKN
jgi:hypothetical protein